MVVTKLVKQKQKGFIRSRKIHNNIIEMYIICRLYKSLEVAVMLNFEKTYDRVDRRWLLKILREKNLEVFSDRYIDLVENS